MAYTVLARQWRPQRFEDVIGQEHVTRTLVNAIDQGRVAHAFLFTGSRGIGKTSTARILAKALNCAQGSTAHPCNVCDSCREITDGRAMDVLEIDGASNRGINEIRELREAVRYAPSQGRYKIYIIDEVHMLTGEAFNALLKTLEEPPPHVVFIFATTEIRKIPVTILSRCQRYDFKRVNQRSIVTHLDLIARSLEIQCEPEALHLIARQAQGGLRDALSTFDQIIAFAGTNITVNHVVDVLGVPSREHVIAIAEAILRRNPAAALRGLEEVDQRGHDLIHFSVALLQHLRDIVVTATLGDPAEIVALSDEELKRVQLLVQGQELAHLERLFHVFAENLEPIYRAPYPKLLLEMALIRLTTIEPLVPVEPLIRRLQALELALRGEQDASDDIFARYQEIFSEHAPVVAAPVFIPSPSLAIPLASSPASPAPSPATPPASSPPPPTSSASSPAKASSPPPSTSPAPGTGASGSLQREALQKLWRNLVATLATPAPVLAAHLEHAIVLEFTAKKLQFWLADHYTFALDATAQAHIALAITQLTEWTSNIEVIRGPRPASLSGSLSIAQEQRLAQEQLHKERYHKIRHDPLVEKAIDLFNIAPEHVRVQVVSSDNEEQPLETNDNAPIR